MGDLTDHFSRSEFVCSCGCGLDEMDPVLIEKLEEVRVLLGRPIRITSGVRCQAHNDKIGGVPTSAHVPQVPDLVSKAVDIYVPNSEYRYKITPLLWERFQRIGFGRQFYHVDVKEDAPGIVMWDYYEKDHVA